MFGKSLVKFLALTGLVANSLAAPTLKVTSVGNSIADKYIVVLKDTVSTDAFEAHTNKIASFHSNVARDLSGPSAFGLERKFHFALTGFKGYAGGFDKATIAEILKSPEVAYVEQDAKVSIFTTQTGSTWGLDRISHKVFASPYTYEYDGTTAGTGVTVYVIDTGIRTTHSEFTDGTTVRASFGYNAVDSSNTDGNGHGTHCAGTIAGKTYGVAKKARVVAVKVLGSDGSGTNSGVIAGMNWVASNAVAYKSVASMSLGGSYSSAVNSAVNSIYNAGVTIVVAAGNENQNAANDSPASAANAITVGAIDTSNTRASFSNYGSIVDVFAPGVNVLSSWATSNTATNTISGTSMACPHVAGLAAYFISSYASGASPATIASRITSTANTGVINAGSGSPNRIAYNGYA